MDTKSNIVVLDGHAINPGDLSWQGLEKFGRLTVYDRSAENDVLRRCMDAEIILTNKVPLGLAEMDRLPNLRYIPVMATGYNIIDIDAASQKNILVTNIPAYSSESVAQHVFAFLLHFTRRIDVHARSVNNGDWQKSLDFSYTLNTLGELNGKTMGIVGYGKIGKMVAGIATAFGMKVYIHSRHTEQFVPENCSFVDFEQLLKTSDFISLHLPLNSATNQIINRDSLGLIKTSAILINTGRGGLIDEQALSDALNTSRIAGAALDVLSSEPPDEKNPLIGAKNCLITPHIAWAAYESRKRLIKILEENIAAYLKGTPQNSVNRFPGKA